MVKVVSLESLALSHPAGMRAEITAITDSFLPVMLEFFRFGEIGEESVHHLLHLTAAEARSMAAMLTAAADAVDIAKPVVVAFPPRAMAGWAEQ